MILSNGELLNKLYASKGIGALVIKKGTPLEPIIYGGGHERGMRSGTLNVSGIVGLGGSLSLTKNGDERRRKRDRATT